MILIALGANLPSAYGAPEDTLNMAISTLENAGVKVVAQSRIWITHPVPASDQPLYRNAVISVKTKREPEDLLSLLHSIEEDFGRIRAERNAARVIDLDLLAYADVIIDRDSIVIPHPRLHERGFVLLPLCEFAEKWMHPVLSKSARELLELLPDQNEIATFSVAA